VSCCSSKPSDTLTLRFSHILSETSEWHAGALRWKELVENRSGGAIQIKVFTNASLSGNNQQTELDMVQAGSLGASWESSILLSVVDPRWSIWSLPWLFESYAEAEEACEGEPGQAMLALLPGKRLVGLAYGFNGFRQVTNSKRPIAAPADLRDLKIRVPSMKMYISLFRTWGADPSSMNFGELIQALREGTMDGQENPLHVIRSAGLSEVQKYLTIWDYSFDPIVLCVNADLWTRLSSQQQSILRDSALEAAKEQRKLVVEREKTYRDELAAKGMTVNELSPGVRRLLRVAAEPVYLEYRPIVGEELFRLFERFVVLSRRKGSTGL
jgi:tripartite ATP-independent transporter DctP family solute receptor